MNFRFWHSTTFGTVVKWQQLLIWPTATSGQKQQQLAEKSTKTHRPQQKSSPKK
jgi:hypothetical protein